MYRRTFAILISVLMVAAFAAGCGDDDSSADADSPTKAEFVKEATTYCKNLYKEVQKQLAAASEAQEGVPASGNQEKQLVNNIIVPTLNKQAEQLSEFGAPEGDEAQVEEIIEGLEKVAKEAEENPVGALSKSDPFFEVDQLMKDYGLDACRH